MHWAVGISSILVICEFSFIVTSKVCYFLGPAKLCHLLGYNLSSIFNVFPILLFWFVDMVGILGGVVFSPPHFLFTC